MRAGHHINESVATAHGQPSHITKGFATVNTDDDMGGAPGGGWKEPEEWERGEDKQTAEGGSLAAFKKKAAGHFIHPVKAVMLCCSTHH